MKNLWVVLLFCTQLLVAQTYHQFEAGDECYLIADNVNVRATASTKGDIVANIPIGTKVEIVKQSAEKIRLKGFKTNWYKVKFTAEGKEQTGYVWGGLIAEGSVTCRADGEVLFLYGIESVKTQNRGEYAYNDIELQLRACKNNKELSKVTFEGAGELSISHSIENFGSRGVDGVLDVIEIGESQEMCAGINLYNIVFWDGKALIYVTGLRPGGDAPYYASDELIYPGDKKGTRGFIIRDQAEGYWDEESKKDVIESHKRVEYFWTGKILKRNKVLIDKK